MSGVLIDELLVFSDHHGHPFSYGSKEVLLPTDLFRSTSDVLYNSRLIESCRVIKQMEEYARKNNIKSAVFCGDLFHTQEAVPTEAFNLTLRSIRSLAQQCKLYLLVGNHDSADRLGQVHSLEAFRLVPNVEVFGWESKSLTINHSGRLDTYTMCFVPYSDRKQLIKSTIQAHSTAGCEPRLLFAHLGIQGAKVGSDYVLINENDLSIDDIPTKGFAGCLFGHFHEHQQLFQNGWYVGATHHHNWGDVNTKRGFLHVRVYINSIEFDFIESDAPRFLAINERDLEQVSIREKDFVKVFTEKKMTDSEIKKVRSAAKSENCEVVYIPPDVRIQIHELNDQNLSPTAMVETWVKAHSDWLKEHLPEVNHTELVEYGKKILTKVENV